MKRLLAIFAFTALVLHAQEDRLSATAFEADLQALTATPHRLAGTDEGHRAGDYIEAELRKLPGSVMVQNFGFPREEMVACSLRLGDRELPLLPLRANGLQGCSTPEAGLTGRPIYLGGANRDNPALALDGKPLRNWIALADFDQPRILEFAFTHGARAIIYLGRPPLDRRWIDGMVSHVSADLPRFYLDAATAEAAGLPAADKVTLTCRVGWRPATGRNLVWSIEGTAPGSFSDRPEAVIYSAPYDTRGLVPLNAPEPERAANAAALLGLARWWAAHPPARTVIVAFFDNSANFLDGGRHFYDAYRRSVADGLSDPWPTRRKYVAAERKFVQDQVEFLTLDDPLAVDHPSKANALLWLKTNARFRYDNYMREISPLRVAIHEQKNRGEDPDAATEKRLETLLAERRTWQTVRERLRDGKPVDEDAMPAFRQLVADTSARLRQRLAELDALDAYIDQSQALGDFLARQNLVLHASLRFTAGGDQWLFVPHSVTRKKLFVDLVTTVGDAHDDAWRQACGYVWESRQPWDLQQKWQISHGGTVADDSVLAYAGWTTYEEATLAAAYEIPGMTLLTENDRAPQAYLPDAAVPAAQLDRIRRQAGLAADFLAPLANDAFASVPWRVLKNKNSSLDLYQWKDDRAIGHSVKSYAYGQTQADQVEPGAVVHVIDRSDQTLTFEQRKEFVTSTDANGIFPLQLVFPTVDEPNGLKSCILESARFDVMGTVTHLTALRATGGRGSVGVGWEKAGYYQPFAIRKTYAILPMFEGRGGIILGSALPFRGGPSVNGITLLNGLSNAEYRRYHFRFDPHLGLGLYFIDDPLGVKVVYTDPREPDNVALYLNSSKNHVNGVGYGPGAMLEPGQTESDLLSLRLRGAGDLQQLDEFRLNTLRQKNIVLNSLEYLHSLARGAIERLDAARARHQYSVSDHLAGLALAYERRVYQPVIATTNDMVVAATLLLILTIPFAFALQSLLIPTHDIYRRILAFAGFFVVTYVILYYVHPAFSFSATPSMIILAFLLLIMSGAVIYILYTKFNYEIKKMQGMATAAHTFQVRAVGNLGAAVALAISTMRRRPVRTFLTVITVVMLTFTIVSFVSFRSERGVMTFYRGPGDPVSRLLVRHQVWKSLNGRLVDDLAAAVGDDAEAVHGRYWRVRELGVDITNEDLLIPLRSDHGKRAIATAMMSLDADDLARLPALAGIVPDDARQDFADGRGIVIAQALADALGAAPGDRVRIDGDTFTVLGSFDARRLLDARQVDGSPFLPVNFKTTQMAAGEYEYRGSAGSGDKQAELEQLLSVLEPEAMEPISPDSLVIFPTQLAQRLHASLKSVVIYPRDGVDLGRLADKLAIVMDTPVFLNQGGERHQKTYGERAGISGLQAVIIPLLLGGLIVFSTMLGSVIDRQKEIYTFSALGLAPRAIAMLFFFEAGIYAVLGGFGGYLLSQITTFIMEWMAGMGWLAAPEMNYSSSAAINTILIVMATVMVSTIYPAISAARQATADTRGSWKIPSPTGNRCDFDFPFTISEFDVGGVLCFIREYFSSHADRTVGAFAAADIEVRESAAGEPTLTATVWLQPFDQGISQRFTITARESAIPEVSAIHISMERLSGPPGAWRRSYTVFLDHLRGQFLLWRTLDDDSREAYLTTADTIFPEPTEDPA